ncbi:Isoniazid inductible gene protein IniC [Mycobacteroides abscessus subsp. abscessus]|uniref:dynamin family protein n=1 Tax=Mycobacteroides abscessus TaxID=36809 RepID=UPI00092B3370|nr:dynamin family protein [Mycobacteroides abscessus]SHP44416.1 Isoniazid inductible gene protein IniC [Mycobacteroides abscessus subsp. abscessus]SHP83981.1 Isoniazid inductible gene protein IniC [Mycobacteroides abscessus subsp. abscessus]SHP89015.1 Isoniazid inductible gene protein IniC [Mycobacteroides abscessus subsp. abscessus]SHP89513.1 Isoniazid inductible gene protein IniC [Mycobacteroides abscessus subsp. abscessus]SHP98906.1 Isoniazid inductible gene protein IniC [Mycobacteroides ab
MSSVVQARVIISDAMRAYQNDSRYLRVAEPHDELRRIAARLDEPIRVAIAGTLNAGKSTLVNALVGEDIAPTDATEATRIVAWFRHGAAPRVTANLFSGVRQDIPIRREGGLSFELDRLDPASVADLDVNWPAPELNEITLIDTPGTSSLSTDVSERSLALLVPEDGVPRVDAVIFLLRSLNAADIGLLTQIGKLVGGERGGAVGVVGVVSRADEIGVGRLDAMLSAREVAARFAGEMERTGICQAVVPVAGLLALTARTLRHAEFVALQRLAELDPQVLAKALLSVDRFVREDDSLPVDAQTRAALLHRFGMFGIRISVAVMRVGVTDATGLAEELLERSGLVELHNIIANQFGQRAGILKSHTALLSARRVLTTYPVHGGRRVIDDIDPLLADTHAFDELRLLAELSSRSTTLTEHETMLIRRLLGSFGTDAAARLGLDETRSDPRRAALDAVGRWRARAEHPLNDPFTSRLCLAAVRSAEGILTQLSAHDRPAY